MERVVMGNDLLRGGTVPGPRQGRFGKYEPPWPPWPERKSDRIEWPVVASSLAELRRALSIRRIAGPHLRLVECALECGEGVEEPLASAAHLSNDLGVAGIVRPVPTTPLDQTSDGRLRSADGFQRESFHG